MSIYSEVSAERATELADHAGHELEATVYPEGEACVECVRCGMVLIDFLAHEPEPQ